MAVEWTCWGTEWEVVLIKKGWGFASIKNQLIKYTLHINPLAYLTAIPTNHTDR